MPAPSDATAMVRGASVGSMSALVTAAAHAAGGAEPPSGSAAVLLIGACAALGVLVASTPVLRFARFQLMVTLALAQAGGHLMLVAAGTHHHESYDAGPMATAHLLAVVIGACVITGAERGIRRAATAVRRVVPAAPVLVVDDRRGAPPLPVHRLPAATALVDLSGFGTRGPPVSTT